MRVSASVDEEGLFAHFVVGGRFQSWIVDSSFSR